MNSNLVNVAVECIEKYTRLSIGGKHISTYSFNDSTLLLVFKDKSPVDNDPYYIFYIYEEGFVFDFTVELRKDRIGYEITEHGVSCLDSHYYMSSEALKDFCENAIERRTIFKFFDSIFSNLRKIFPEETRDKKEFKMKKQNDFMKKAIKKSGKTAAASTVADKVRDLIIKRSEGTPFQAWLESLPDEVSSFIISTIVFYATSYAPTGVPARDTANKVSSLAVEGTSHDAMKALFSWLGDLFSEIASISNQIVEHDEEAED